jgi:small conductance mechanosensitive channel
VLVLVFKPYKVGDVIEVMGQKGEVKEIQIFNTILSTADNRTVILPNGSVSNSLIVNQSKQGNLRATFEILVDNSYEIDRVRKLILEIVNNDKRVITFPSEPSVIITKLSGGGYTLQIRFFTAEADNSSALADIMELVNKDLIKRGIGEPTAKMIVYKD